MLHSAATLSTGIFGAPENTAPATASIEDTGSEELSTVDATKKDCQVAS